MSLNIKQLLILALASCFNLTLLAAEVSSDHESVEVWRNKALARGLMSMAGDVRNSITTPFSNIYAAGEDSLVAASAEGLLSLKAAVTAQHASIDMIAARLDELIKIRHAIDADGSPKKRSRY